MSVPLAGCVTSVIKLFKEINAMSEYVHVLGISGSLRKKSYNTALLRAAAELAPPGMTVEIFDLGPIPLFNADLEADLPTTVQHFKRQIAAADALLIAAPEYNYSITGVLKNAIDWASRPRDKSPLNGKPLAIMGAGGRFGTVRAQAHLRYIVSHNGMLALPKPELMIERAWEHFDAEGNLTTEAARAQLRDLLSALLLWTRRLRAP
jgi:chromate reductase